VLIIVGGNFEDGFVTGVFSHGFNQALHKNPASAVANRATSDGQLDLGEANDVWRNNNDPNFRLTVDAGQLTVKQTSSFRSNGTADGVVTGADWFTHGSVTLQQTGNGIEILPGQYDFQSHGSFWDNPVRNFATYGGFYLEPAQ